MAATVLGVMAGIATRLGTITDLRVSQCIPEQINPPQAIVGLPVIPRYRSTMGRGRWELDCTVTVLVSRAVDWVAQETLARYADPTGALSIVAAIEGDRTLGGVVDDCVVTAFRPLGSEEVGVIGYYGGSWDVSVIAPGT